MTPIEFHTNFLGTPKKKYHEGKPPEDYFLYDCPFCEATQHLYFFPINTVWDCKRCGRKGNVHIFNQLIYNEVCNKKIKPLLDIWKLPLRVFKDVKFNPLNDTFVIPTFRDGKLNNLYKIAQTRVKDKESHEWKDKLLVLGTPSLPTALLNWTTPESETVWLCEGQKDKFAADAIIGNREIETVGVPGASSFQQRWVMALQDKHVVICFDNDDPGKDGTKKIIDLLKNSHFKPKSVKRLAWPEEAPKGYDLYDVYQDYKAGGYQYINANTQEIVEDDLTKTTSEVVTADDSCDTFDKALTVFGNAYYLTDDTKVALAMVLASIYSTNLEGEQVWIKLIGRPGCGKSTISKAISASEYVKTMSTFTGLFSGYRDQDEDKDNSLVPHITNRTLVVKDADALLQQANIEKIMSELRDFYDKDSTIHYRTGQQFNYQNVRSTFIMMGTQVLRRADHSFLGERLLSLEMDTTPKDEEEIKKRVVQNALKQALKSGAPTSKDVMAAMKGYINHLKEKHAEVTLSEQFTDMIVRLCTLAAKMRTQVDRDFKGRLLSPAIPELPTRLIGQMINAAISLCVVFDIKEPDKEVTRIVKKVMRDTINPRSHRFAICDLMLEDPGITIKGIISGLNLPKGTVEAEVNDLIELKFVVIKKVESPHTPGMKARGLWLHPNLRSEFLEITQ